MSGALAPWVLCVTCILLFVLCCQGCGLSLESLGLEMFSGTSRLVSVLKVERLRLISVLRVQRLSLEDITSRSRDFSLVNIHAKHRACGYITKKIMDLTRKKHVVK